MDANNQINNDEFQKKSSLATKKSYLLRRFFEMQNMKRWMILSLLILAVLSLAACGVSEETAKEEPYHLEEVEGSEFNRVILTEKAAERLGIETAAVMEGETSATQVIEGEVTDPGLVRVSLAKSVAAKVDTSQPVQVLLDDDDDDDDEDGWLAELFEPPDADDGEDEDEDEDEAEEEELFFTLASAQSGLSEGQPIFVKLPMAGSGVQGLVIPYAALLYGINGETWAYTNPAPLTFVRQPITVDYIDGGLVYLLDGPAVGTEVVTVGAPELFGADTGVGK
jgi:hypothetical protein